MAIFKPTWSLGKTVLINSFGRQVNSGNLEVMKSSFVPWSTGKSYLYHGIGPDWVWDLKIPQSLDYGGFATDGAWHLEQDDNNEAKLTWDRTRHNPNIVLHKPTFLSGTVGSETDYLIGHWKCDDNVASTTIVDETGNYNGTLQGGDNTEDKNSVDAVKGKSLLLNGTDDYLDLSSAMAGITDLDLLTIQFKIKPNFAHDTVDVPIFYMGYNTGTTDYMRLNYDDGTNKWDLRYRRNSTSITTQFGDAFTSNNELQQWRVFSFAVNFDNGFVYIIDNGQVVFTLDISSLGAFDNTPDTLLIGKTVYSATTTALYIDEVKLLDGCILPYGAYFTGNGAVDTDVAHKDILFYWDGSDCTASNISIGALQGTKGGSGGSFVTSGGIGTNDDYFDTESTAELHFTLTNETHISYDDGSILCWFNIQTIGDGDAIFGVGDSTDYIQATMDASGNIDVTYSSQSTAETITGDIACGTDEWHCLKITFDDTNGDVKVHSYIDDVENGTAQDIANTFSPNSSDVLYLGADYAGSNIADILIDEFYITNKAETPQIWSAMGVPLHIPLLEVT